MSEVLEEDEETEAIAREAFEEFMRTELEDVDEEDILQWATLNTAADDASYAAYRRTHVKLLRARRKKHDFLDQLEKGGRAKKQPARHHIFHGRILADYFGTPAFDADGVVHESTPPLFSPSKFIRRFRMSPKMFMKLYHDITDPVTGHDEFRKGLDALGVMGVTPLQKLVSVVRQLAYGCCSDIAEEYTGVPYNSGRDALYGFCDWINVFHGPTFLGAWTAEAIKKEMDINAERGFTGMLGSIDCTHWNWGNCPMAWAGQFQDRTGIRSVIAEAVAGHDMYFWHCCLGFPGSINDIQVLGRSTISMAYLESPAATVEYTIGEEEFTGAYFLADGIYPNYAYLMKTISNPATAKEKYFSKAQEGCRKDVERAFGRLLSKWHILDVACRSWFLPNVCKIWRTCFILHNMTLRDNQNTGYDSDDAATTSRELRREHARVRRGRGARNREGGQEVGGVAGGEPGEGGHEAEIHGPIGRQRMADLARQRRQRASRRAASRGGVAQGGGRGSGVARGRGRGGGGRGSGTGLADPNASMGERFDQADTDYDLGVEGVGMNVLMSDWTMVMEELDNIQCEETNRALKQATILSLWEKKGLESE